MIDQIPEGNHSYKINPETKCQSNSSFFIPFHAYMEIPAAATATAV